MNLLARERLKLLLTEEPDVAEVERDLNQVVANDWTAFIKTRLYDVQPRVNTEGIEQAGYRLEYTPDSTPEMTQHLKGTPSLSTWFSIGLDEDKEDTIRDVRVGSAADKASLAPGQKLVSINGRVFTLELLTEALKAAKDKGTPIHLTVQDDDVFTPVTLHYSGGLRYPRLTRIDNTPDLLTEILRLRHRSHLRCLTNLTCLCPVAL